MSAVEGAMLITTGVFSVAIYLNLLVVIQILKRIETALPDTGVKEHE